MLGDKSMIERCIEGMSDACERIIVVGGFEYGRLRLLVERFSKVECTENISYEDGMFTSVKAGLSQTRGDRCFLLPADIPLVPPHVYHQLLTAREEVVVPSFRGRNGHPVLLSRAVLPRILSEPDNSSLQSVLRSIGFRAMEVDAEEVLIDVDTPHDYERISQRVL
jgi:molybdenum cofactor cytidylyltransferase